MRKPLYMLAAVILGIDLVTSVSAASLKMAYDADPISLDPHENLETGTLQFSHMVFDPLVRWSKDLSFEPRLAEEWQQINSTTMRFYLRKGVKFHSGNNFTATDVIFTFNRLQESPDFKGIFTAFKKIEAVDDYTVDLITDKPYPLLINNATYIFPMDSKFYTGKDKNGKAKDALIKSGDTYASTHTSGTGPYIVTSREKGVKMEFIRNDSYWDDKSPGNVDAITLTAIKEGPTRVAALLSGDVDFIAPVPPTDQKRIADSEEVNLVTLPGTRIITLQLNQKRVEHFRNLKVRQAIVYAVDQEAIVEKVMKGFATPAAQLSPKGYLGHNESLTPRFNLDKAKALMKEAGLEDGFSVSMMAPNNRYVNDEKIAQAVASMLAKINIKVDLKTIPKAQYWPEFDKRAADIMMMGWQSDTDDSNNFYEFLTACPDKEAGLGQYNTGNYCNKDADLMMQLSNAINKPVERAKIMQGIEKILYDDAAYIPLHWQHLSWAADKHVDLERVVNVWDVPYLGDLVISE